MKVALSVWENCISTVFDAADNLLIVEIDEKKEQGRTAAKLEAEGIAGRTMQLTKYGIDVLICGAVSREFQTAIECAGIKVYPFVRGPVEDIITAYQQSWLDHDTFVLPGCRKHGCGGNRQLKHRRGWDGN